MAAEQQVKDILQKSKLRVTQPRKDILQILLTSGHAISHQDIESKIEDLDRITLYRTLKTFVEKAVIHSVMDGTGITKYALCDTSCTDANHHHHDHVHFHCTNCTATFCVEEVKTPKVELPEGYVIQEVELIMKGLCNKCNSHPN